MESMAHFWWEKSNLLWQWGKNQLYLVVHTCDWWQNSTVDRVDWRLVSFWRFVCKRVGLCESGAYFFRGSTSKSVTLVLFRGSMALELRDDIQKVGFRQCTSNSNLWSFRVCETPLHHCSVSLIHYEVVLSFKSKSIERDATRISIFWNFWCSLPVYLPQSSFSASYQVSVQTTPPIISQASVLRTYHPCHLMLFDRTPKTSMWSS